MPHDSVFCRLRDCVRDEIASTLHDGGGRARQIARSVCARHPELIGMLGNRLVEDAVTRLVNREIKQWNAVGTSMREQLVLPGMLAHVRADLPAAISVPSADDDDDDPIYRPLFGPKCATVGELRTAVAALWKGIADDQRKARALTRLLDLLISAGAADDRPVSAALQEVCGSSVEQAAQ
ncbi:MAG: hypothetical protein P9C36_02600 [Defluviicoccus sp.]|nr:hypothetical protein [Defluviicoccus sp.]MDG4591498.1 hypothetical protein [Defluviicoccus sp.]